MPTVIVITLVILTAVVVGGAMRARHRGDARRGALRRESLEEFASHVQAETERARSAVARELHDQLGGLLVSSKMDLDWIARRMAPGDETLKAKLAQVSSAMDTGLAIKRRLVERLYPSILDHLGLYAALQWQLTEQCGAAGVQCVARVPDDDPGFSPESAIVLFRIEHDAIAHALAVPGVSLVELDARVTNGQLEMSIAESSPPTNAIAQSSGRSWCWSLAHRAESLGGSCASEARPVGGQCVQIRVPVTRLSAPKAPD